MEIPKKGKFIVICRTEEDWKALQAQINFKHHYLWNAKNTAIAVSIVDSHYYGWCMDAGEYYRSDAGYSNYTFIEFDNNTKTMTKKVTSMAKKMLDEDSQTLVRAGFISETLSITAEGSDALREIMFDKFKAELVAAAKEKIATEEKE